MRIMLDSNVLFSALIKPESMISQMVEHIKQNHTLVLAQYIIDEYM
jgi:predicted nucleic acid-binding protein